MTEIAASAATSLQSTIAEPEASLAYFERLTPLPPLASLLLAHSDLDETQRANLVEMLRAEPQAAAALLTRAQGRPDSGRVAPRSPADALDRLGYPAVRSQLVLLKLHEYFETLTASDGSSEPSSAALWRHGLAVGVLARRLAAARGHDDVLPHEAFVAGLLHDFGKIALRALFPRGYARVISQAEAMRGDIADFERTLLGVDHARAGRRLAELWALPTRLREVIWLHHLAAQTLPASVEAPRLIGIIQLADVIVREEGLGYSGNHVFYEHSPQLATRLGLEAAEVSAALRELPRELEECDALLSSESRTSEASVRALASSNAELGRSNQELARQNRKLENRLRYFAALQRFEKCLGLSGDLRGVAQAICSAAANALDHEPLVAFALGADAELVQLAWLHEPGKSPQCWEMSAPHDFIDWSRQPGEWNLGLVLPADPAVRSLLAAHVSSLNEGRCWIIPIVHEQKLVGGICYATERDERLARGEEIGELRDFLQCIALAVVRGQSRAATLRLADDLAETNRRLQQTQAELLRSRTLSIIAEMAAGAGHELNSPLTVISGRAQLLRDSAFDPEIRRSLELISSKAHECSRIVSDLMDFARPRVPVLAPLNLVVLVDEVRREWLDENKLAASRVRMPDTTGETLPRVPADAEQLKTVVRELLGNAADAIGRTAGNITIRFRAGGSHAAETPALHVLSPSPLANAPSAWVELVVQDTGCGMSPAVLQRVFDPFFSHRKAGRRRGLGLARAFRIVESHGGRIWLESSVDEGTSAHVILPQAP